MPSTLSFLGPKRANKVDRRQKFRRRRPRGSKFGDEAQGRASLVQRAHRAEKRDEKSSINGQK
jgi:hypothetical protein